MNQDQKAIYSFIWRFRFAHTLIYAVCGILFMLTGVGAVVTGPCSVVGLLYTNFNYNPLIGLPEIAVQTLIFSWLFCIWQTRPRAPKSREGERARKYARTAGRGIRSCY